MQPLLRLVHKDEPYPDPPMIRDDRLDWPDAGWAIITMAMVGWGVVVALAEMGAW